MGRTWSVGRSVNAHGPVDHDSVGLAQSRPNNVPPLQLKILYETLTMSMLKTANAFTERLNQCLFSL